MIATFKEIETIDNWNARREKVGELLGLTDAVPSAVLRRIIDDRKFAAYLVNSRHSPELLQMLFDAPQTRAYEEPADVSISRIST